MKSWQTLLAGGDGADDLYGPHGGAVMKACEALGRARWLQKVGRPLKEPGLVPVHSWEEALAVFETAEESYEISGHLRKPAQRCHEAVDREPERGWWEAAVATASEYATYDLAMPDELDDSWQDWLDNYLYQYVSYLMAEIIGADAVGSTYFRELLPWFYAGRFPCGWVGDWPAGKPRLF